MDGVSRLRAQLTDSSSAGARSIHSRGLATAVMRVRRAESESSACRKALSLQDGLSGREAHYLPVRGVQSV